MGIASLIVDHDQEMNHRLAILLLFRSAMNLQGTRQMSLQTLELNHSCIQGAHGRSYSTLLAAEIWNFDSSRNQRD
jgi:hypothetical protein